MSLACRMTTMHICKFEVYMRVSGKYLHISKCVGWYMWTELASLKLVIKERRIKDESGSVVGEREW